MPNPLDLLEVFTGQATAAEARLYVRLSAAALVAAGVPTAATLGGTVGGPKSAHARTLEAKIPLTAKRGEGPLVAEALIPDPLAWCPDGPFVYEARVELRHAGQVIAETRRTFGVRTLATVNGRFELDRRPWRVRGVRPAQFVLRDLPRWREAGVSLVVPPPSDELCAAATWAGVPLIVEETPLWTQATLAADLARYAPWPAVAIVVVKDSWSRTPTERAVSGRPLLAEAHPPGGRAIVRVEHEALACEGSPDEWREAANESARGGEPMIGWTSTQRVNGSPLGSDAMNLERLRELDALLDGSRLAGWIA